MSFGVSLNKLNYNNSDCRLFDNLKQTIADPCVSLNQDLLNHLNEVDSHEMENLLTRLVTELLSNDLGLDPIQQFSRLAAILPVNIMNQILSRREIPDILREAEEMFEEAKLYVQMTSSDPSPSVRARIASILDGVISVLESVITAFGIGDFFIPAESEIHADCKSQKIMMLLSFFSMIMTVVLPVLGGPSGGLIIGGVLLGIVALSVIWPLVKPRTTYLPGNAENWTQQIQHGALVSSGRQESLNVMADALTMNRHVMLVGPSGVGKSLTAKAFAQAIERGDYPALQGKVVFRINTADIVGHQASFLGGGNQILKKISTIMGRHRNEIILVLDEIHMACKNKETIADQLKTCLDEQGAFPHVIGITTKREYCEYVKNNHAFARRFDVVEIRDMDAQETLRILGDALLRSPSRPIVEQGALECIYETSCKAGTPQPTAALTLLQQCINRTQKKYTSSTETEIIRLSHQVHVLRAGMVMTPCDAQRRTQMHEEIRNLERMICRLQTEASIVQEQWTQLVRWKDLLNRVTTEIYSTVLDINTDRSSEVILHKQLHFFALLREFLSGGLLTRIRDAEQQLQVKVHIDQELVSEESRNVLQSAGD